MGSRDPRFFTESKAKALQIPDIKTAMEALKLLGVDPKGKGIKNKDDAIRLVIEQLDSGVKAPAKQAVPRGLRKALEDDQVSRGKLLQKYEALHSFYRELPQNYKKDLGQVFPDIETEFENRRNEIKKSECTILVAGETASGKSSLINLLLGVDILPTSQLGCTSTICEIRTSKGGKKEAIAYHRMSDDGSSKSRKKQPPVFFDLGSDSGLNKFREAVRQSDDDGDSPYDRIELYWPFMMLEDGMVIVDTPGIGGGGNMAKYAERYLSKSYGFIYVINSANAGGIQKDRLINFMRMVINSAGEDGVSFESTMFVCNRWDMVPDRDREAVKADTVDRLARYYKGLRRSQVHYMSIMEAAKALQYQTTTPEYIQLMDMVEKLLPDTLRNRLNSHYRWMSAVLKRSIYSLKVSKVMEAKSMERVKEEFAQIKRQINMLEQNSKDSISYLKANISQESETVVRKALDALQSPTITGRVFDWRPHDLPMDDKRKVIGDALECISNRLAKEMNLWERENNIVFGIKDKIIRVCKRDFELMEGQIAKLEGALLDGDTTIVKDLHKSFKKQAPVRNIWKKAAKDGSVDEDTGTYKGLGGAIVSVSPVKPTDRTLKKIFDGYRLKDATKCIQKMEAATKYFLDSIFESKNLQEKVHVFFKRFIKGIDAVAKMIPDFLKADLQLMDILRSQMTDTETNLKELFPTLIYTSHSLLGQLDLFFVNYVMVFDYAVEEIAWDQQDAPVGSGSFADVYIGRIRTTRRDQGVALKVCRDPLKEGTVTDILLEDRTLRELDHPNIVRYFGATYRFRNRQQKKDMQWIMLLEVCPHTMKTKFVNPDVNNPGKMPAGSAAQLKGMVTMADYVLQLCKGLHYLHQKGFVHRDLKLENILMTDQNVVKLTDVGLTKSKREIAFSVVGSPVYMALEVLTQSPNYDHKADIYSLGIMLWEMWYGRDAADYIQQQLFGPLELDTIFQIASQNYDHKADIYSLGIMLWEMWYGRDAADYIQQQLFGPLEAAIKDGLRPSLKLATKAPDSWRQLFESSVHSDPDQRPAVDVHCKFFEQFLQDSKRM